MNLFDKSWHLATNCADVILKQWLECETSLKLTLVKRGGMIAFRASDRTGGESKPVGASATIPPSKCAQCGRTYQRPGSSKGKFCSTKCFGKAITSLLRPKAVEMWNAGKSSGVIALALHLSRERVCQYLRDADVAGQLPTPFGHRSYRQPKPCRQCGKSITQGHDAKFCSRRCVEAHWAERSGSQFRVVKLTCAGCGKEFERSGRLDYISSKSTTTGMKFCTLQCYRKNGLKLMRSRRKQP